MLRKKHRWDAIMDAVLYALLLHVKEHAKEVVDLHAQEHVKIMDVKV